MKPATLWYSGIVLTTVLALAALWAVGQVFEHDRDDAETETRLEEVEAQLVAMTRQADPAVRFREDRVEPLVAFLLEERWTCSGLGCADSMAIDRIATALLTEAEERDISDDYAVGVLMVENPWLDTLAVSYAGALGLLQVMPLHRGSWSDCGVELQQIEAGICTGMAILESYVGRDRAMTVALLRYSGCVSKPGCEKYPDKVRAFVDPDS